MTARCAIDSFFFYFVAKGNTSEAKEHGTEGTLNHFSFYVDPLDPSISLSLTILLVRHGAHDELGHVLSGRSDIALNAAGQAQVASLSQRLSAAHLTRIDTSPRRRARDTAAIIAERHGLEAKDASGLDEVDFGEWAGQSFAALGNDRRWQTWNAARGTAATPSGETMAIATARALRHLEGIEIAGVILCVSHCDIIRGIVAHYLGLDVDRLLSFDIDPASITTIQLHCGVGRVIAVNERCR